VLAGVVAAGVLIVGGGAVLAQSADGEGSTFLDRVAQKLGIESDDLENAIRDTRNEDIDAAVERGDLTRERADHLKEKLDSVEGGEFFGHGPFGRHFAGPPVDAIPFPEFRGGGPRGFAFGFGFGIAGSLDDLASFLGISADQLKDELAAGDATLASVAETHGKSRDELKDFISDNLTERLDQAVADGNLTREQAGDIRERMDAALDRIIDNPFGFGRGRGQFHFEFHHRFGDDSPESPNLPATPQAPQSGARDGVGRS
jgi:uncharacterized protein YidB (DUF937 family)